MDAEIQEDVEQALNALLPIALSVQVSGGVVTLDGAVENDAEYVRVDSLARQVNGVVEVINNLVVEPPTVSLETLGTDELEIACAVDDIEAVENGEPYFPPTDPVVWPSSTSEEGLEVRGGFAPDSMDQAFTPHSHETLQHGDDEISEEVERALSLDAMTADLAIEVETIDGVVYLRGEVGSLDEAQEVEAIASIVPGVVEVREELDIT